MGIKTPAPILTASQMDDLAKELGSSLLAKAADEQHRKEQKIMKHRIGNVTMKVIDGIYYQLRPQGWIKVNSLSDVIFEDVRSLPINNRVKAMYACRAEVGGEVHKFNVTFSLRNDIPRAVVEHRVVSAIACMYGAETVDVFIGRGNTVEGYRVINGEDVRALAVSGNEVGGATTIELEV